MLMRGAGLQAKTATLRRNSGAAVALPAPIASDPSFKLTFDEQFSSFSWNSNPSGRDVGQRTPTGTWTTRYPYDETRYLTNPLHDEKQYYADPTHAQNPFSIVNNALRITAQPSNDTSTTQGQPYVSGLITTDATFRQQYGYFEIRCKLPEGQGFWPIFWMLTREIAYGSQTYAWPPEIDILETHGDKPLQNHWNVHWYVDDVNWHNTYPPYDKDHFVDTVGDAHNGFHRYGLSWDATNMSWYVDDVLIKTTATPVNMNFPMFLLFNFGVGGVWPNYPDETTPFPAYVDIDYIRAWSNASGAAAIVPSVRLVPTMPATPAAAATTGATVASVTPTITVADNVNTASAGNRQFKHTDGLKRDYQAGPGNDTLLVLSQYGHLRSTANNGTHTVQTHVDYKLRPNIRNLESLATTYGVHLTGNALSNIIKGSVGQDDLIYGGGGDDVISLRGGSNIILTRAGKSNTLTITDFKPGRALPRDRMLLSGYGFANIAAVMAALAQVGSDVVLTCDNTEKVVFQNTTLADFNQGNFRCTNVSSTGGQVADFGWVDDLTQPLPPVSLYSTSDTGSFYSDGTTYSSGIKFKVTAAGKVTKLKVYKSSSSQTFANVKLWNFTTSTLLATAPATTGSEAVGWITLTLTTPITLTPNTVDYEVSYRSNGISNSAGGLIGGRTVGPISAYANFNAETTDIMPVTVSNSNTPLCDIVFVPD